MRKGLLAISLVLLLSLAFVVPSCNPTTGTIEVKATLDGAAWTGAVSYTLTPVSGTAASGSTVSKSFTLVAGTWTCAYVSGGPGAFVNITPSATQTLVVGETKTFTLNFVTVPALDARISFESWTINGQKVAGGQFYTLYPNDYVDVEYKEHMYGPAGNVTVHQTAWLKVHNIGFEGQPGPDIVLHVANEPGAVFMDPPSTPMNQKCTVGGLPAAECDMVHLPFCEPVTLDVEIDWNLEICQDYIKTINWISFPSPAVLFHIVSPLPPLLFGLSLNLTTWANVNLPGDTDPSDDTTPESSWIVITYQAPPP